MYEVYIERRPERGDLATVYVWFSEFQSGRRHYATVEEGKLVMTPLEGEGALVPPLLELPAPMLANIAAEASGVLPPSQSMDRHLRDATETRDRLLTIVEHKMGVDRG